MPDISLFYDILWEDDIDMKPSGRLIETIELICTNCSKNYILSKSVVVKMPKREDDNTMLLMNMIYERQIKRVIQYFYLSYRSSFAEVFKSLDFFVISASNPTIFLDYASISPMNVTLDSIRDPNDLEYWILIVLDYLAFLHRNLHLVNLDIKP